ncbi:MFS transporter [Saccharopolyspora rhizosphaerae]|uniref:MFS transporter n=1 Tax=Saccharopolyspora rhizosphaerae TaxID=2492662 RepID=A0A426JNG5_9PSEU|nr:MFS transporter [Saccharopolyspora rhizosphaerae]RRO14691.1 MFS transporter [Saccharopolyspora rhizosphaerae]
MPLGVWALALAAFAIGTTEFVPLGILPILSTDFGVSIADGGHFIAAYAVGVVVGAPSLTVITSRWPRKMLLVALLVLFLIGNVLTAAAPSFSSAVVARFVTGLPHGAFFGAGAMVAAHLASHGKRASAVARMLGGLAAANVLGVPAGVLIAARLGWKWTFLAVAALGAMALVAVLCWIPHQPRGMAGGVRREFAMLRRPQVLLMLTVVVFGFAGVFACYSYVAPLLTTASRFDPGTLPVLLVLIGIGMTVGTHLGGAVADKALVPAIIGFLAMLSLCLALISVTATSKPAVLLTLIGVAVAGFAVAPAMQTRVMELAHEAAALASAAVQAAFNVANSLGAWAGGLALHAGLGLTAPSVVGSTFVLSGLILMVASAAFARRGQRSAAHQVAPSEPGESRP